MLYISCMRLIEFAGYLLCVKTVLENVISIVRCSLTKTMNISVVALDAHCWSLNESASWQAEHDMRIVESNTKLWQAELNADTSIFMTFSGCEQCCQMPLFHSPTLMTEMKLKSGHVHNWNDQRWDSNSRWTNHRLGDIWFSTQFFNSSTQVTAQEFVAQNITKHAMITTTVAVSPLIITLELETLTLFCFSRNLLWLCQWHFAKLITVKKSHDKCDWPSVEC